MKNLRVWEVASVDMPDLLIDHTVRKARAVGLISQSASIGATSPPRIAGSERITSISACRSPLGRLAKATTIGSYRVILGFA